MALKRDLIYALRGLRNSPTFTAVAVASLALGIGLNTAIFNLVSVVLLRPLPVAAPARLVSLFTLDRVSPGFLYCSYPNYKDYRDRNTVFSGLLLSSMIPATLTGDGEPEDLTVQIVSGNYFDVLGVKPALGRTFLPEEDRVPGAPAVAVISDQFWRRKFAASPSAVGATVGLNNLRYTIVGVAPRGFRGASALVNTDVWVPFMMYPHIYPMADWIEHRKALLFVVVGRLKDGVSRPQAQDNLRTLAAQLAREYPADNQGRSVALLPLAESVIQPNSRGGFVLVGGVALAASGLVLLIACANLANLLLVRAAGRRKEMALRLALGAGHWRLIRQMLTESALLAAAGGAAALALGRWTRDLLWAFRPPWMLSGDSGLGYDGRVWVFTLLLAVLATAVFGLAPALAATRAGLAAELRERRSPWTRAGRRVDARSLLVLVQVAMSVVALAGAGLFLRSLRNAQATDPGFDAARMASLTLDMKSRDFTPEAAQAYFARVLDRVRGLPGVAAATLAGNPPFSVSRGRTFSVPGKESAGAVALIDVVEPGYFQAVGIPLLRGRDFTAADAPGAPRVGFINQTMARRFWPAANPLGARLQFSGEDEPVEIAGVVKDSTYINLEDPPRMMVYLSLRQSVWPAVTLWVRSSGPPEAILSPMRRAVQDLDRGVILSDLQTAPLVMRESLWAPRLGAILFAAFGVLAGLLTLIGIYGVISYSVGQRTRELGIRMALGAQPGDLLRQVLAQGMILVCWGLVLGLLATLTIAGALRSLLFGVSARDPLTLALVAVTLLAAALAACAVPALRATRIHPMTALREE